MSRSKPEYDLCVIGGGAGGLVVAAGGASLGAKVILVEKSAVLGGDCLHYGCVPSKTLIRSAKVAQTIRSAGEFGLRSQQPEPSIAGVMERVAEVIATIQVHDSVERFEALGVEVVFGSGRFTHPDVFRVGGRRITAKRFVIATGSRPAVPPIAGLDKAPYLTNETVFSLREPVPRLIVLGGGPIGLELAQAFVRLGSQVTVVEAAPNALGREDHELAQVVVERLAKEGVKFYLDHRAARVEGRANELRLAVTNADRVERTLEATHLLVATGRSPNVDDLDLDVAGVEVDRGRVVTDARLRTTNKNIYACGDVVGPYQFTHMAEHHAGVVLRNAIFKIPAKVETSVVPWCTFTDPELARVGLSENEATAQAIPYRAYAFAFRDIDRAQADGETDGLAKIVTTPKGRLLGAAIVGPHAGELIHEYVLALSKGLRTSDLSKIIHVYPTLAQINRRVADARMKEALTPSSKRWIKRLFRLRGK